jgi:hypothetical protein
MLLVGTYWTALLRVLGPWPVNFVVVLICMGAALLILELLRLLFMLIAQVLGQLLLVFWALLRLLLPIAVLLAVPVFFVTWLVVHTVHVIIRASPSSLPRLRPRVRAEPE